MKQLSHLSNFWPPENGRLCIKGLDSKQFMQYFCQPLELNLKVRTLTSLDCLKSIYYNLLVYNGKATMKYTGLWSKNLLTKLQLHRIQQLAKQSPQRRHKHTEYFFFVKRIVTSWTNPFLKTSKHKFGTPTICPAPTSDLYPHYTKIFPCHLFLNNQHCLTFVIIFPTSYSSLVQTLPHRHQFPPHHCAMMTLSLWLRDVAGR